MFLNHYELFNKNIDLLIQLRFALPKCFFA